MGSIFKSKAAEEEYYHYYAKCLEHFDLKGTSRYIATAFGDTYVTCFGDSDKQPLILLHGMTMSSTMWYPNIKALLQERCVYAVDVMGDFGKSKPAAAIKTGRLPMSGCLRFWMRCSVQGQMWPAIRWADSWQ